MKVKIAVPLNQDLLIIVHVNSLSDSLSISRIMCSRDPEKAEKKELHERREDDDRLCFSLGVPEVKYD